MTLRHFVRDLDGTLTDMSAYAPRIIRTQSKAEEGAVGSWSVVLDDPLGELNVVGHHNWFIEDDESEDEDRIIWGGWTGKQTYGRLQGDQRRTYGPEARVITIELWDANTYLSRTIMKGADTKRPAETDVERMQWLLSTDEAGAFGDVTTFVDTSGPVNMDAGPLRGTYFGQIATDCAMESGKNFFATYRWDGGARKLTMWYGSAGLPDYVSPFFLSNDLADLTREYIEDGTAVVWDLSDDATMERSPDQQYCGCYAIGEKGVSYKHDAATHALIAAGTKQHRDMVSNFPMVRSKPRLQARATRQLVDVRNQIIRVRTTIHRVPQHRLTLCKQGMLVQIKGTHWGPDLDDWHEARVVSAEYDPVGPGKVWNIHLELATGDASDGPPPPPFEGSAFAGALLAKEYDPGDELGFQYDGDSPPSGWYATPNVGPIHVVQSSEPHFQVELDDNMTVRIEVKAAWGTVATNASVQMTVTSSIQGILGTFSDSIVQGLAAWSGEMYIDIHDVACVAGEVITIAATRTGFLAGGWGNVGANDTFLRVGRGTHFWGGGPLPAETWVGP